MKAHWPNCEFRNVKIDINTLFMNTTQMLYVLPVKTPLCKKVNYIHLNPVRAGLVEHPDEYLYSSAKQWHGKVLEDEPLLTDHKQIKWRAA